MDASNHTPPTPPDPGAERFASEFLADLYAHLPVLVVRLTVDGIVLSINPMVTQLTGYEAAELAGKNWWGMMYPGKLFAQVPKFISCKSANGILRDHPMTLRTKHGGERVVAWTRFARRGEVAGPDEVVCLGIDLTDRLTLADVEPSGPQLSVAGPEAKTTLNAGEVDGSFVLPLAISPPVLEGGDSGLRAIQQVHEFLLQMDEQVAALGAAFGGAEIQLVEGLAAQLRSGAHACGLLDLSVAADRLQQAAHAGAMEMVARQVGELMQMCHRAQEEGRKE